MMNDQKYNPGDVVRLSAQFHAAAAPADPGALLVNGKWMVPVDPDEVRLWVKRHGDEAVSIADIDNPGVGHYRADVLITDPGLHYYRWESEGTATAAEEATFVVTTWFESQESS